MYPEIHYMKNEYGITIVSCYGYESVVVLPDEIEGLPVTEIAPYAFSETGRCDEKVKIQIWNKISEEMTGKKIPLVREQITELYLPKEVTEIGRYAFYRCRNLRKLSMADGITEVGGGALNGCIALREVEIHLWKGEKSALKSITDEVRFEIHVTIIDHRSGDLVSELLFPEHYEEAVENTPARLLYTSHHGAGGYYRQCFSERAIDYKKYDGLLPWAIAEETTVQVFILAMLRLRFPCRLSESAKASYEAYVKENLPEVMKYLVEEERNDLISFISVNKYWNKEALDAGIDIASIRGKTELLSIFMDEKQKHFPKKKKTFEL